MPYEPGAGDGDSASTQEHAKAVRPRLRKHRASIRPSGGSALADAGWTVFLRSRMSCGPAMRWVCRATMLAATSWGAGASGS